MNTIEIFMQVKWFNLKNIRSAQDSNWYIRRFGNCDDRFFITLF